MGRARKPERGQAQQMWENAKGEITIEEIAQQLNQTVAQVRKWKSLDKWEEYKAAKKKRGGQKKNTNAKGHGAPSGNENAKGHGAPKENKNAETHGAYSRVRLEDLPEEERKFILSLGTDVEKNMEAELQALLAKESDLEKRIKDLNAGAVDMLHVEREVTVEGGETTTTTTTRASTFEQTQKLETASSKVHGRIIKLLDSIRGHEAEKRRADLEWRRHNLTIQRLSGVYEVDELTGLVDDTTDGLPPLPEDVQDDDERD